MKKSSFKELVFIFAKAKTDRFSVRPFILNGRLTCLFDNRFVNVSFKNIMQANIIKCLYSSFMKNEVCASFGLYNYFGALPLIRFGG